MRVISLIITTIGALFSSISNTLAWGEKLQQRTETFLRLDELLMDLRYEVNIDEDTLNTYINRYKDIYREDNKKGLENARTVADSLKNLSNESKNK